jgi:hypothetical protein
VINNDAVSGDTEPLFEQIFTKILQLFNHFLIATWYEWVMERQGISTHKESGIINDANLWAIETMNNARYPLDLLLRVITVSLETMKIVEMLPRLEI